MAKPTKTELEIMCENLRELLAEKNVKLNKMAKDKIALNGRIKSLKVGNSELSESLYSSNQEVDRLTGSNDAHKETIYNLQDTAKVMGSSISRLEREVHILDRSARTTEKLLDN